MKPSTILSPFKVSEIEISYRNKVKACDRPKVTSSQDTYALLFGMWEQNKLELVEQCNLLLLDRSHACLGLVRLSTGGMNGCIVDPKIAFATALKTRASSIILAHNHPSGNLQPSRADRDLTDKIYAGGRLLDIMLLDHLIVTREGYLSFADEGLMPSGLGAVPLFSR